MSHDAGEPPISARERDEQTLKTWQEHKGPPKRSDYEDAPKPLCARLLLQVGDREPVEVHQIEPVEVAGVLRMAPPGADGANKFMRILDEVHAALTVEMREALKGGGA